MSKKTLVRPGDTGKRSFPLIHSATEAPLLCSAPPTESRRFPRGGQNRTKSEGSGGGRRRGRERARGVRRGTPLLNPRENRNALCGSGVTNRRNESYLTKFYPPNIVDQIYLALYTSFGKHFLKVIICSVSVVNYLCILLAALDAPDEGDHLIHAPVFHRVDHVHRVGRQVESRGGGGDDRAAGGGVRVGVGDGLGVAVGRVQGRGGGSGSGGRKEMRKVRRQAEGVGERRLRRRGRRPVVS